MATSTLIGQHRFTQTSSYINDTIIDDEASAQYSAPPGETGSNFEDVYFTWNSGALSSATDYHMTVTIPRFTSESHTVLVYLTSDDGKIQQFLKKIVIPAVETDTGFTEHKVVIYAESDDGDTVLGEDGKGGISITDNGVQLNGNTLDRANWTVLAETWKIDQSDESNLATESFVFRPLFDTGTRIYYKLDRQSDEYRINNGKGYKLSDKSKCVVEGLKNIVSTLGGSSLTRIGVWGRPGLEMAINGEAINIGRSGYYELDSVPVTSLAIYAKDFAHDNFSIDYQYVKNTESTSG